MGNPRTCIGCIGGQFKPLAWVAVLAVCCLWGSPAFGDVLINEVDADQTDTDTQEYVELYNTGPGTIDFTATPHVLVFYNGGLLDDPSYFAIDLTGTLAAGDYLVIGSTDVPNVDIDFCPVPGTGCDNILQNGADAVALYTGTAAGFPNGTPPTATNMVDAIVYDTSDDDDTALIAALTPGQPQINENGGAGKDIHSNQRCPDGAGGPLNTGSYGQGTPTPGTTNICNADPAGACCFLDGSCDFLTAADCTMQSGTYQGDGTDCATANCPQPTGGCCNAPGGTCTPGRLEADCLGDGHIYLGDGSDCSGGCPDQSDIKINEVRIDQSGDDNDEYFELVGLPTTSLAGLTYVVIGDSGTGNPANSGAIEEAIDLTGFSIPADGYFLAADSTVFTMAPGDIDIDTALAFENSDNVTHLLVSGFSGTVGDDLDTDDDCTLDVTPWVSVIDRVALILDDNLLTVTECHYGTGPDDTIGPNGLYVPSHVFRLPDAALPWEMGEYYPEFGDDTPGAENVLATGACCNGNSCTPETRDDCANVVGGTYKGRDVPCDPNPCIGACCIPDGVGGATCNDTLTQAECEAQTPYPGTYQGDATTCIAGLCDCQDIEIAKTVLDGTVLKICDVVVTSLEDTTQADYTRSFTVQDTSGTDTGGPGGDVRGIMVFAYDDEVLPDDWDAIVDSLTEGDIIEVNGTIGAYANLKEIIVNSVGAVSTTGSTTVPTAVTVTTPDFGDGSTTAENLESVLVELQCVAFTETGNFAGGTNYHVTDGTNVIEARVPTTDALLDGTPIPVGPIDLTGVFSQNSFGAADVGYELTIRGPSDLGTAACPGTLGACCFADGTCVIMPQNICEYDDGTYSIPGTYQGDGTDCDPNPCIAAMGACCVNDVCTTGWTQFACEAELGDYLGDDSTCEFGCPDPAEVVINEVRIDQTGTDYSEYFELKGPPGTPLASLTYLVIGDTGSGTIEAVVPLTGQVIPADGHFLAAESSFESALFGGETPDFVTSLNFENGDNVTHLLVSDFSGSSGDDLDPDDDCDLDVTPWSALIDGVALIEEENPPTGTECHYGGEPGVEGVGPDGSYVPGQVYRCDGEGPTGGNWLIGVFAPPGADETPGTANPCVGGLCLTCPGDMDGTGTVDYATDLDLFVAALLSDDPHPCADVNEDENVNGLDVQPFVDRVLANGGAGTACNPLPQIIQCQDAGGPGDPCTVPVCVWVVVAVQPVGGCFDGLVEPPWPTGTQVCLSCWGGIFSGDCSPAGEVTFLWMDYDGAGLENNCLVTLEPLVPDYPCEDPSPCGGTPYQFLVIE